MRTRHPIFGRGRESNRVRKGFGITDKSRTGLTAPTFNSVQYKTEDGSFVKMVSIGQFADKTKLGPAGTPMQPTLRIARSVDPVTGSGTTQYDIFLESCWIHIVPGTEPGQMFYSPHLKAAYDARAVFPPWLDWAINFGQLFRLRSYTNWMDDTEVYKRNHGRIDDALYNNYSHSGRIGKFTRCLLGSKGKTELFLAVLKDPGSTILSYFIRVDEYLNYWLMKVTQTGVFRALILFSPLGNKLHAKIRSVVGEGNLIDATSPAHAEMRKAEGYLFGAAINTGPFQQIAAIDITGLSIYTGWQQDYNGDNIAHTTLDWEPGVAGGDYKGIRSRIYTIAVGDGEATLTEKDSAIGTPGIEDLTIYYPDNYTVTGRMNAWFPKGLTDTWDAELETDIPIHAWYKEDNTLCEAWFKHAIDDYLPHASNYNVYTAALGNTCGSGIESFSLSPLATISANGFYIKNSPAQPVDLYTTNIFAGLQLYDLEWELAPGGGGQACLDTGKSGLSDLEFYSCHGTFDASAASSRCCGFSGNLVSLTCGNASWTRDYYASRTKLLGSILMFNFHNPASATIIKRLYEGWAGHTTTTRNWTNQIVAWSEAGCGADVNKYPWDCVFTGSLHPTLFSSRVCTGDYYSPCITAGEGPSSSTGKASGGITIDIEHYLVTHKEVVTVLNDTFNNWDDAGYYEYIAEPTFAYPHIDVAVSCYAPTENRINTGDFLSYPSVGALPVESDMTIPDEHLGLLTKPIGLA